MTHVKYKRSERFVFVYYFGKELLQLSSIFWGSKIFTMKNSWQYFRQFLFLILPLAMNGQILPEGSSDNIERTLQQIKKYIENTSSTTPLGPIPLRDSEDVSVQNALEGYRYLETAKGIIDRLFIEPYRVESYLASITPSRSLMESCHYIKKIHCNSQYPYRNLDGSCNNLRNPYLGKDNTPFERFLPSMYVDGLSDPRTHSFFGATLPEPRILSTTVHENSGYLDEDKGLTNIATVFGNFLNHDLQKVETLNLKDCCQIQREFQLYSLNFPIYTRQAYDTLLSMSRAVNSVCMAIHIPGNDRYFSFYNRKCMQYARSTSTPGLNCKLGPRQQRNTNTHLLDGSPIYGSTSLRMRTLRTGTNGSMSTFSGSKNGPLLPQDFSNKAKCRMPDPNTNKAFCFRAGDSRVNDQPTLTTLHTLFVREHNRIAQILAFINSDWDDEKLFQEARKIVVAQLQQIVYKEYLPIIVGDATMKKYGLTLKPTGYSNEYSELANPAIRSVFGSIMDMTLATLSRETFNANGRSHKLSSSYLDPNVFYKNTNALDSIVEEMLKQKSRKFDRLVTDELTNRYQEKLPGEGSDLVATIIQRSRDHGLPVYLAWLMFCGFKTPMDFSGLPHHDAAAKRKLSSMYVSVYDLDLVTAGVMETPLPGAKIGPTFACIIGTQFQQIKKGDRFWYENPGVGNFTESQLSEIRKTTFAKLIRANTNITTIQRNVFLPESSTNPRVNANDLPILDPCIWRTKSGWGDFSPWTRCVFGTRMQFRNCEIPPDGPCTCIGSPIKLERCPTNGNVSNIISKKKFESLERFLIEAALKGELGLNPSLSSLSEFLQQALNQVEF